MQEANQYNNLKDKQELFRAVVDNLGTLQRCPKINLSVLAFIDLGDRQETWKERVG